MKPVEFHWWNLPVKAPLRQQEEVQQIDFGLQCLQKQLNQLSVDLRNDFKGMARASDHTLEEHNNVLQSLKTSLETQQTAMSNLVSQVTSLKVVIQEHRRSDIDQQLTTLINEIRNQQLAIQQLSSVALQWQSSVNVFNQGPLTAPPPTGGSAPLGPALAPPHDDLQLDVDIQKRYGEQRTEVRFAIVTIPDPRVPRHHRAYDTELTALTDGMIRARFVLDDFNFPWASDPETVATDLGALAKPASGGPESERKPRFGLMVFRRDCWRTALEASRKATTCPSESKTVEIRALYIVPERATFGVDVNAFRQAMKRIVSQTSWLVPYQARHLLVFGPAFSGSMDSLARAAGVLPTETSDSVPIDPVDFKVISASATADSNTAVPAAIASTTNAPQFAVRMSYQPLTVSDDTKIEALENLTRSLGVPLSKLAILYESTVFGLEAARKRDVEGDDEVDRIPVPVNVADVRYGLADKNSKAEVKAPVDLPQWEQHLALDEGAENGTEFPREESHLTPTSSELALQAVLKKVHHNAYRVVAVAATDVRDRLFLFDQLRSALPGAMFVDLGTDRLLTHSDFVHASRGVLTLASSELDDCGERVVCAASTDYQSLLADGIEEWASNVAVDHDPTWREARAHWHLVTRTGLISAQNIVRGRADDPVADFGRSSNRGLLLSSAFIILGIWGVTAVGGTSRKDWRRALPSPLSKYPALASSKELIAGFYRDQEEPPSWRDLLEEWAVRGSAILASFLAVAVLIQGDSSWTLAFVAVLFLGWYLSRHIRLAPWQYHVAIFCLGAALLITCSFAAGLFNGPSYKDYGLDALESSVAALGLQWRGGLASTSGFCIALVCLLCGFSLSMQAGNIAHKHWKLLECDRSGKLWLCSLSGERAMLSIARLWIFLAVVIVTFEVWHVNADGIRLTVFGRTAGVTLLIALLAITLLGLAMLMLAIGKTLGVLALCRVVPRCVNQARQTAADAAKSVGGTTTTEAVSASVGEATEALENRDATIIREVTQHKIVAADNTGTLLEVSSTAKEFTATRQISNPDVPAVVAGAEGNKHKGLRFENDAVQTPDFLVTPILVMPGAGGAEVAGLRADTDKWGKNLCELLDAGVVKNHTLLAFFALLVGEIGLIQLAIAGVMLTSLAATVLVFVFPISDGDGLLLLNLFILTLSGVFSGLVTIRFETDEVLSWVLCNRRRKAELSPALFGYVAFPFVILAVAIAIADIPGVLNWGGSIFSALLEVTKPGSLK